jgi:hypothetical protein
MKAADPAFRGLRVGMNLDSHSLLEASAEQKGFCFAEVPIYFSSKLSMPESLPDRRKWLRINLTKPRGIY